MNLHSTPKFDYLFFDKLMYNPVSHKDIAIEAVFSVIFSPERMTLYDEFTLRGTDRKIYLPCFISKELVELVHLMDFSTAKD